MRTTSCKVSPNHKVLPRHRFQPKFSPQQFSNPRPSSSQQQANSQSNSNQAYLSLKPQPTTTTETTEIMRVVPAAASPRDLPSTMSSNESVTKPA